MHTLLIHDFVKYMPLIFFMMKGDLIMNGVNTNNIQPYGVGCNVTCGVVTVGCVFLSCSADGFLPIGDALAPKIAAAGGVITTTVGDAIFS